ncbi:MAG: DUF3881 family protein [Lachnospiraceae bacterium]|nr:DUF3881 family protein [Lachnospiraceae bacterium]
MEVVFVLHKYLRAVGFSKIKTRKQLEELITECVKNSEKREYITMETEEDGIFVECTKEFASDMGIVVRGEFDEENNFSYDYYFPYLKGSGVSSEEDVTIERHAEKESYAGVCDDLRIGVTLIFYFQNIIPYLKLRREDRLPIKGTTLILSGLSTSGSIMLPIIKNEKEKKKVKKVARDRNHLIAEARKGDEEAIESLTLEDMDTYTTISRKIQKEDVFSIVDTYFMPYGVECDQYSVLGEITACELIRNKMTSEEIHRMTVNCNELIFDICINKEDLLGEPEVGRRFKGTLWMQGFINFPA